MARMATISTRDKLKAEREKKQKMQFEAALAVMLIRWLSKIRPDVLRGVENLNIYQQSFQEVLTKFYQRVKMRISEQVMRNLQTTLDESLKAQLNDQFKNWSDNRAMFIGAAILETMSKRLQDLTEAELTRTAATKQWYDDMKRHLRNTVSLTETQVSVEHSKEVTATTIAQSKGITLEKTWITVGDERVRLWHQEAEGQSVPLGTFYKVGGEDLMYPGDPRGSLPNIINCRCSSVIL